MHKFAIVVALLVGACGGDDSGGSSGVDSSKQVKTLSSSEVTAECTWGIALEGGAGHQTMCDPQTTITVHTQAQCEASLAALSSNSTCTLTVEQLEACTEAQASDPCGALEAQVCAAVLACAG